MGILSSADRDSQVQPGRVENFVNELRSRSVIRALITYAVVAWMLLQVADVTFDRLPLPDNAMTVLIVLVVVGFPVTGVLAWGYEITIKGIVRHEEVDGRGPRLAFFHYIAIVIVVSALTGYGLYYASQNFWEPSQRSIAVLPFVNDSGGDDTEYFSDGLTEEVRSIIIRLGEFRVVNLGTSIQLKDAVMDVVSIASRLGAEVVLQGSVRRYQDKVSVTTRLIDGGNGSELWSEKYDRELSDIYTIQEDIARQVARALHVVLPVAADRRLKNLGTRNVEAFDSYLRAIDILRQPLDETSLLIAEGLLRESLALDPNFAKAHAAMCRKHLAGYRLARDATRFGPAEEACLRALDIDDDAVEVRVALGNLYVASGKNESALKEFEAALGDNANLADIYIGIADAYVALNRPDEAEASLRKAISTDVSNWSSFNAMGNFLFGQGRFLEAAEFYQMFVNRASDNTKALSNLGSAYYMAGRFREAAEAWEQAIAIRPGRSVYSNTGTMYFFLGEYDKAADRYALAANFAPNDYIVWSNLADAYYFGEKFSQVADVTYKRALALLEQQLSVNPGDAEAMSMAAHCNARLGNRDKALEYNARARGKASDNMYVYYNSALVHAQFGQTDEALEALERAVALDYQVDLLPLDPAFEGLRDEPRFKQLVEK
jgi:TolB-like protein/tetratricopeptide (TPR) repeat protein